MANYPNSIPSFTTKSTADVIQASHMNSLQDEVVAIGTDLLGAWTDVAFVAGNYTGNNSMTWTLTAPDQEYYKYKKLGKTVIVAFKLATTTVGGTPSTALRIALPFTPTAVFGAAILVSDNGAATVFASGLTSSNLLSVSLVTGSNWSASTNATSMVGTIVFESTT